VIESGINTYHNHPESFTSPLRPKIQDHDPSLEIFSQTSETLSSLEPDTQDLALATLINPEFQETIFPNGKQDPTLSPDDLFQFRKGTSLLKGDFFEYFAYTYQRTIIDPEQEIVSPQHTGDVYKKGEMRDYFKDKHEKDPNAKHAEMDMLVLEKRGERTQIIGGCEVTVEKSLRKKKKKQLTHMCQGEAYEDLITQHEPEWRVELGEIFNGHYPDLPKKITFNPEEFNTFLILPEKNNPEEKNEKGLSDFNGVVIRAPITRNEITELVKALKNDLDYASGILTNREVRELLDSLSDIVREKDEEEDTSDIAPSKFLQSQISDIAAD